MSSVGASPIPRRSAPGRRNGCPDRFANQTIWELTDNASWFMGAHHLTLGTHDEMIHLDGSRRVRVPAGRWCFASLDSLERGCPDALRPRLRARRPGRRAP